MKDNADQQGVQKLVRRSLGWCLLVSLWTIALLTTAPAQMGAQVVPSPLRLLAAKSLHVTVYAFLTVYLSWIPLRRWLWLLLALLSLHAAGTEFGQHFIPGRTGQVSDVIINHIGLLLGLALTWKRWLPRSTHRVPSSTVTEPLSAAGFLTDR